MSTKAEAFLAKQQRKAQPKLPKKVTKAKRNDPVDTSLPGVSATDRRAGHGPTGSRNESARGAKKGGVELEQVVKGPATRKSTRRSAGGVDPTSNQRLQAARKAAAPSSVASRAATRA